MGKRYEARKAQAAAERLARDQAAAEKDLQAEAARRARQDKLRRDLDADYASPTTEALYDIRAQARAMLQQNSDYTSMVNSSSIDYYAGLCILLVKEVLALRAAASSGDTRET